MSSATLVVAYGQSNADIHIDGPPLSRDQPGRGEILVPDDGFGIRGVMGRGPAPREFGFAAAEAAETRTASLLLALAARLQRDAPDNDCIIIRSAAKGGRQMLGSLHHGEPREGLLTQVDGTPSLLFRNFVATIAAACANARRAGIPVGRIYIVWVHGESDVSLPRRAYTTLLRLLIRRTERALAYLEVRPHWLLVQPGGTTSAGNGNRWPNRLALYDVAAAVPNAAVVATGYAQEYCDPAHLSARGKTLLGEGIGRAIARQQAGLCAEVPRLEIRPRTETEFAVAVRSRQPIDLGFLGTDPGTIGFTVEGRGPATIASVEAEDADRLLIRTTAPLTPRCRVGYAYAANRAATPKVRGLSRAFGTGRLRTMGAEPSIFVPGATLHDWVGAAELAA